MDRNIIGAQLYTLRDYLKRPADIIKSLRKVKKIGFDIVQVSGLGEIAPVDLKKILDDEGLKCVATHESGIEILDNTEVVIEKLNVLECKHTAYPHPHKDIKTEQDWIDLAENLNKAGKKLREASQFLSYHNHAIELQQYGKKTALDILYDETNPKYLAGEIDTYWIQFGGGNPVTWCEKLKNRMPVIHLKDYGIINNEITMFEVGYGNLDMRNIVKNAMASGTEYFVIEQDTCQRNPFDSLRMSLEYLLSLDV